MALGSCVYAYRRLTRPGMSLEIRKYFIRKHILYVITFIIIWTFFLASTYYHLYADSQASMPVGGKMMIDSPKISAFVDRLSIMAAMMTGFIMAIIRVSEPYFKFLIKKQVWEWFGLILSEKEVFNSENYMNDTLATFLTSSLNVELVHIILKSITKHTQGKLPPSGQLPIFEPTDFKAVSKFTIDSIKIDDPDKWKVATLPQFLETKEQGPKSQENPEKEQTVSEYMAKKHDTIIISEDVEIKEFAPDVFAYLRHLDGIDSNMIRHSLSAKKNRDMVFKAGESQGKSGSFFFFSHDRNFIIKTMNESDMSAFKRVFAEYYQHVSTRQNSLLARIYGVYSVKMEDIEPVNLILMGNTKKGDDKQVEHVFDLKGSIIHREVKGKNLKPTATLKDVNMLNLCKQKLFLRFKEADRITIMEAMEKDVELLCRNGIMDYSLLFAVESNPLYKRRKTGQTISVSN